jgi:hypothetical protein
MPMVYIKVSILHLDKEGALNRIGWTAFWHCMGDFWHGNDPGFIYKKPTSSIQKIEKAAQVVKTAPHNTKRKLYRVL